MKTQNVYIEGASDGAPFLKILIADNFFHRLKGLMFRKEMPQNTGLLLIPCNSIHMCFMCFAIDAIYIDREHKILKVVKNLKPWVGLSTCRKAWATLEIKAGEAERYGFAVGKKLIRKELG